MIQGTELGLSYKERVNTDAHALATHINTKQQMVEAQNEQLGQYCTQLLPCLLMIL
jgi:hypothetical protein